MKKSDSEKSPGQMTAYERWELPVLDDAGTGGSRRPGQQRQKPPTAAELEEIREAAYQEGLEQGRAEGLKAGHKEGFEVGRKEGHQQGLQSGQQQGRSEALQNNTVQIQSSLQQLHNLIAALQQPVQQYQEEVEEALLNLVLAISRSVIFKELHHGREQILAVVREALAALPNTEELATVYINPADAAFLTEHLPAERSFRYQTDAKVMPGGCRVETRHTLLDYTVEKRFQAAVKQMLSRHSDETISSQSHDYTDQMGAMSDFHRDLLESETDDDKQDAPSGLKPDPEKDTAGTAGRTETPETDEEASSEDQHADTDKKEVDPGIKNINPASGIEPEAKPSPDHPDDGSEEDDHESR